MAHFFDFPKQDTLRLAFSDGGCFIFDSNTMAIVIYKLHYSNILVVVYFVLNTKALLRVKWVLLIITSNQQA